MAVAAVETGMGCVALFRTGGNGNTGFVVVSMGRQNLDLVVTTIGTFPPPFAIPGTVRFHGGEPFALAVT